MDGEKICRLLVELCEEVFGFKNNWYCMPEKVEKTSSGLIAKLGAYRDSNRSFGSVVDERIYTIEVVIKLKR